MYFKMPEGTVPSPSKSPDQYLGNITNEIVQVGARAKNMHAGTEN
jgi:hypothetical protein